MSDVDLLRVGSNETGTRGVLRAGQIPFAVTLELPWLDNAPQKSCIPVGTYVCKRYHSEKYPDTFEITEVPGREKILFHMGNKIPHTLGCVIVAEKFTGEMVLESAEGFGELMAMFKDRESFTLSVLEVDKYLP